MIITGTWVTRSKYFLVAVLELIHDVWDTIAAKSAERVVRLSSSSRSPFQPSALM